MENLPTEIQLHILSFLPYPQLLSFDKVPDSIWREKSIREFGISKEIFNRYQVFQMTAEERYLYLACRLTSLPYYEFCPLLSIQDKWQKNLDLLSAEKFKQIWSNENHQIFRGKIYEEITIDCLHYLQPGSLKNLLEELSENCQEQTFAKEIAKIALEREKFEIYSFLDPNHYVIDDIITENSIEDSNKDIFRKVILSQPDDLGFLYGELDVPLEEIMMICFFCLSSRFEEKIAVALDLFERYFPKEREERKYHLAEFLMFDHPKVIPYVEEFFSVQEEMNQSEFYVSWTIRSLLEERIIQVMNLPISVRIGDLYSLIDEPCNKLVKKLKILNLFSTQPIRSQLIEDENFKEKLSLLALSMVQNGEIDLFWSLYRLFPEFISIDDSRFVIQALENQQFLVSRCLFHMLSEKEKTKVRVRIKSPTLPKLHIPRDLILK